MSFLIAVPVQEARKEHPYLCLQQLVSPHRIINSLLFGY